MDILYKLRRVIRWGRKIGFVNSASFELQQTVRRPVISFFHSKLRRRIYLRGSTSDISVFEQVFVEEELNIELDAPKFIIDGGANCGLTSLYFACHYPDARILAVEPSSDNCWICSLNVSGLNVEIVQTAIWSSCTNLKIENPAAEHWSFRCIEVDEQDPEGFTARDMQSLLDGNTCDFLKLDIEGAECEIFENPTWLENVSSMVVEIHGEEADTLIRHACKSWSVSRVGEKILLVK